MKPALPILGIRAEGVPERVYAQPARARAHVVKQKKLRGGYSEIVACAWLLENGYEVFRNVADRGAIDLIAIRGKECILIDVKTINIIYAPEGIRVTNQTLKAHQVAMGIVPLYVTDEGVCGWSTAAIRDKLNGEPEAL